MNFHIKLALAVLCSGGLGFGLAKIDEHRESGNEQRYSQRPPGSSVGETQPVIKFQQSSPSGDRVVMTRSSQMEKIRNEDSVFGILYHAFDLAHKADPQMLRQLSAEALQDIDPLYSYNVASIFIEKMVADDPVQAMAFVEALASDVQRVNMVSHVLTSWVRYNEDKALDYFQGIADLQLKSELGARFLMDSSLSRSFIAAVIQELGPLAERLQEQIRLRNTPAEDLFAQALDMQGQDRRRELQAAAWRWFSKDQEAALQEISNLPTASERDALMQRLLAGYVTRDPQRALELLNSFAAGNDKVRRAVLAVYASSDPAQAVVEIERYISVTPDSRLVADLLASWVSKDSYAAIRYAQGLSAEDQRRAYVKMASRYLASEPVAALEWAASLGEEHSSAQNVIFRRINDENVAAAQSLIFNAESSQKRTTLIKGVSSHKAKSDPASTLDWLGQFEGESGYQEAYRTTLTTWSRKDPESVAYHIEQHQDLPHLTNAFENVARTWYAKDKTAALNWVTGLPDSVGKQTAVAGLIGNTAHNDSKLAMELFDTLPPGDLRDKAGFALMGSMDLKDKESARAALEKLGLSHLVSDAVLNAVIR